MQDQKCEHEWRPSGLWDGRTPEGDRTGGNLYICDNCGEKAYSKKQIEEKGGGKIIDDKDVFGRDLKR